MTCQLLIDADFTLFQAASAVERESVFTNEAGSNVHVLHSDRDEVRTNFLRMVEGYMKTLSADEAVLVFSGPNNFRKDLWDGYKAHRKTTRKPLAYWAVIDDLRASDEYRVVSEDCLEGDDYIGILSTRPSVTKRIVVSDDKDMMTLPNVHIYRHWDGHQKPRSVQQTTDASAEEFWLYQTLMGDATDGYKGCPGIGPVAAQKVLERPGDQWQNVLDAYRKAHTAKTEEKFLGFKPDELALLNARLARILRATDWDGKNRQPILWSPEG